MDIINQKHSQLRCLTLRIQEFLPKKRCKVKLSKNHIQVNLKKNKRIAFAQTCIIKMNFDFYKYNFYMLCFGIFVNHN